jgi:hypothetical protein
MHRSLIQFQQSQIENEPAGCARYRFATALRARPAWGGPAGRGRSQTRGSMQLRYPRHSLLNPAAATSLLCLGNRRAGLRSSSRDDSSEVGFAIDGCRYVPYRRRDRPATAGGERAGSRMDGNTTLLLHVTLPPRAVDRKKEHRQNRTAARRDQIRTSTTREIKAVESACARWHSAGLCASLWRRSRRSNWRITESEIREHKRGTDQT